MIRPLKDRIFYQPVGRLKCGDLWAPGSNNWCGLLKAKGRGLHVDALQVGDWIWLQPQTHYLEMFSAEGGLVALGSAVAGYWRAGHVAAPPGRVALRPDPDVDALHKRDSGLILLRKSVPFPRTGTLSTGERVLWDTQATPQLRIQVGDEHWIFVPEGYVLGTIEQE